MAALEYAKDNDPGLWEALENIAHEHDNNDPYQYYRKHGEWGITRLAKYHGYIRVIFANDELGFDYNPDYAKTPALKMAIRNLIQHKDFYAKFFVNDRSQYSSQRSSQIAKN